MQWFIYLFCNRHLWMRFNCRFLYFSYKNIYWFLSFLTFRFIFSISLAGGTC
jgi:hypothetical protein